MNLEKVQTRANIVTVQKNVADDFAKFAAYNHGCLPVLVRTEPGNRSFKLEDPDLTRHISPYRIYRNGKEEIMGPVSDDEWDDMVTFYIGCSFSFDESFLKYKIPFRHIEQNTRISVYLANFSCHTIGIFKCKMVVSMRPVPEHQLSLVANLTSHLADEHGAPIHIGNPDLVVDSEKDCDDPDFHSVVQPQDGDVPVFWACGIVLFELLKNTNQPLAICQSPGLMDVSRAPPQEEYNENKPDIEKCQVVKYSDKGQRYSILSVKSVKVLANLENASLDDPGECGNDHLFKPADFLKSALALSHAHSVAFIAGFPCLPGVYNLAAMLQALGKEVTLIVDGSSLETNIRIMEKHVDAGILQEKIKLIPFDDEKGSKHILTNSVGKPKYDVILATTAIDGLFDEATKRNDVIAIGISNLVCYGLAFALYEMRRCQVHDRYYRRATGLPTDVEKQLAWALPTIEREKKNLEVTKSFGICDGRSPHKEMSADGYLISLNHSEKIIQMGKIISV